MVFGGAVHALFWGLSLYTKTTILLIIGCIVLIFLLVKLIEIDVKNHEKRDTEIRITIPSREEMAKKQFEELMKFNPTLKRMITEFEQKNN